MMRPAAFLLAALPALFAGPSAFSQAATPARPAMHHTAATGTGTAAAMSANAPGIPRVTGIPKTLFSLRYIDTVVGTGPLAEPRKWYTVNYTGYLTTGKKFDSSLDRHQPITFPYGAHRVITGWDTGFEGMHVGGKRRLLIPYQLAYGESGNPTIPGKSNLIFDVELLEMSDKPPAPPTPPAAARPQTAPDAKPGTPDSKPGSPETTPADPKATPVPAKPAPPVNPDAPADPTKPATPPPAQ